MERLTNSNKIIPPLKDASYWLQVYFKLKEYEEAEKQGVLLKVDSKDELIEVLATKLLHSEFGRCYMCKNPMKNITLDGVNNGCDGQCSNEETTVDDFLKKIVSEIEYKKKQALKQMKEV